jgi:selenoprotein W-related protein
VAALLDRWQSRIRSVEIVPGTGGVFDVDLDGERVFTKSMLGRYPDPGDVIPLVAARIEPDSGA